ncbi:MAG: hypothetical protein MZV64_19020 [Ignavibacteriales bacterium]|nr:hypothetical protein [Ignavibacteriales bacterium]
MWRRAPSRRTPSPSSATTQDVMAVRQTGWALLSSGSVQEAHDFAAIAQMRHARSPACRSCISLTASAPRTKSTRSTRLTDEDLRAMIDDDLMRAHRARAPHPEQPGPARHRPEPGCLLPGARSGQPLSTPPPRHRPESHGQVRQARPGGSTTCSITSVTPKPSA